MEREAELEERERDRLPFAALLEQGQQVAVVVDRLVERPLLPGAVGSPGQVGDRLVLVVGCMPVVGEQAHDLVEVVGVAALEPLRRPTVEGRARVTEQQPVGGLLDERMLEPVLGLRPAPLGADQVETLQLVQGVGHLAVQRHDALEQLEAEAAAERRRGRQHVVADGIEAVDAGDDHALDGLRDLDWDLVVEAPAAVLVDERTGVRQRAHELFEEEGVAFGLLENRGAELLGQRAAR